MALHLLLFIRHFANITQTSLIILQRVFCVFSVSDHNINGLQPDNKQIYALQKGQQQLEIHRGCSESHKASLVQVEGGQAVDVVHLL